MPFDAPAMLASIAGKTVLYTPDVLGRPTQVMGTSGFASSITYHPSGQLLGLSYTNGTTTLYGQNTRLWPNRFTVIKQRIQILAGITRVALQT